MKKYLITETMLNTLQSLSMPRALAEELDELKAVEPLTSEQIIEIFATCHDGYMYPQDNYHGPRAMRITEGRAIEAHITGEKA